MTIEKSGIRLYEQVFGNQAPWRFGNVLVGVNELWLCIYPNVYIDKNRIPDTFEGYKVIVKENWQAEPT